MAYDYAGNNTRPHWGLDAATDEHLELFQGQVDSAFEYNSIFREMQTAKSVEGQSNTARFDRMSAPTAKVRQSGDAIEAERLVDDKLLITVNGMVYTRKAIDYADDWTSPSRMAEITKQQGIALAKQYDQEHIAVLQKIGGTTAPADLNGFYDGHKEEAVIDADLEVYADNLVKAHAAGVAEMIERDLGELSEFVTLVSPTIFNALMNAKKLLNVDFSQGNGDFAQRRIAFLNGVMLKENARFVKTAQTTGFGTVISADEAAVGMVTFIPDLTVATVEAKPIFTKIWDDEGNMTNVSDSMGMYTVAHRRPDAGFVVQSVVAP